MTGTSHLEIREYSSDLEIQDYSSHFDYCGEDALLLTQGALLATNGPCLLHVGKKTKKKTRVTRGCQTKT